MFAQALKEISEKQEDYLPVVQGRVVATGSKEDIFIIRELLSRHGVEIKPFPEVLNTCFTGTQVQILTQTRCGAS